MKKIILAISLILYALMLSGCFLGGDLQSTPSATLEPLPGRPTPIPTLEPLTELTPEPEEERTPSPGYDEALFADADENGNPITDGDLNASDNSDDQGSADTGNDDEEASSGDSPATSAYTNSTLGFAGESPDGYKVRDRDGSVLFIEPLGMEEFSTRLTVYVRKYSTDNDNLRDHAEIAAEDIINEYGVKMTDRRSRELDGVDALEYTFRGSTDFGGSELTVRGKICFTIYEGKMYTIIYTTTEDKYEAHDRLYRRMRDKFDIL